VLNKKHNKEPKEMLRMNKIFMHFATVI
jgi:hypothetical protein